ncbi:MAG TPA: thioredoxin domain-containing protein [Puia sp.]|nr:thioredoxin domain-containing protein [Puia sp.]
MVDRHANRLAKETSPYLLQHAHNPVDWYPWGEEALQTAREQDKPVLVSIGYSACHWCHVMERESFEDAETARFMNEHFINIKIDREERPDLDHIYMDAVQAMTGSGGWPLNVFLTPDARPFYGGTYFPPRSLYNRNSWREVLAAVSTAFRDRRAEIENQAATLTRHVATAGSFGIGESGSGEAGSGAGSAGESGKDSGAGSGTGAGLGRADNPFQPALLDQIRSALLSSADTTWGGFGGAPKFPQTFSIRYLLYDYYFTRFAPSLDQACLSLDRMIRGGIYDQLGGGFARYSTDNEWLAPHFEKMLYDNALLVITLSEAFQLTKKPLYREAIEQTIAFVTRELSNGHGAFYAALDADSQGIEGKYYVWDAAEIDAVLGEDAALFKDFYGVTAIGNWEGKNILTRPERRGKPGPERAGEGSPEHGRKGSEDLTLDQGKRLESARSRLLEYRNLRVHPGLDDKILLGWNALMNLALSKAFAALGEDSYRDLAIENMRFLREHLRGKDPHLYSHTWKGAARLPAFLDDYACLIAALIQLQEITGDTGYLDQAAGITRYVIRHFGEPETGFFFYTHDGQDDLILRKREIYDGATPSGNSMMASNLLYLSVIFHEPDWAERASRMSSALIRPVTTYPGSFGGWATLFLAFTYSIPEVVITGRKPEMARKEFLSNLIPYRVFQSTQEENTQFPLLRDKPVTPTSQIFLCKDYACQLPVNEVATALRLIENVYKFQG